MRHKVASCIRTQPLRLGGGFVLAALSPTPHFQDALDVFSQGYVPLGPIRRKHCEHSSYEIKERTFVHPHITVLAIVYVGEAVRIVGNGRAFLGSLLVKESKVEH
jgi:hypothetical protein